MSPDRRPNPFSFVILFVYQLIDTGSYKITHIPTGEYLAIVISKNTNSEYALHDDGREELLKCYLHLPGSLSGSRRPLF